MKVAFVTGANKGIGRAIVEKLAKTLCPKREWDIYLTARNEELGKKTCFEFEKQGLPVKFHQLDITDASSRKNFIEYLKSNYADGVNIAISNAGIKYKDDSPVPFDEQARVTMQTNFFDTLNFTEEIIPLLAKDARVVIVSSMGSLMMLKLVSEELYKKFTSPMNLTELRSLAHEFIKCSEAGDHEKHGWPSNAYRVSKLFLTKASYILGDQIKNDPRNIVLNACCPGYVKTDLTCHMGHRTPEDGADTPVYLATLPVGITEPINEFVSQRTIRKWSKETEIVL